MHLSLGYNSQRGFEPLALREDKQCVKLQPHLEADTLVHYVVCILHEFRFHFPPPLLTLSWLDTEQPILPGS